MSLGLPPSLQKKVRPCLGEGCQRVTASAIQLCGPCQHRGNTYFKSTAHFQLRPMAGRGIEKARAAAKRRKQSSP